MGKIKIKQKNARGDAFRFRRPVFYLLLSLFCVVLTPADCRSDLADLLRIPDELVPERDVALDSDRSVAWKKAWDQARYLARTGDYPTAGKKYEELLALKGNVEQARWEYARLLMISGKWEKAATELELLVERNPDRVAYLNSLGLVSRKSGKFSRALDLFGKAYEKDPADLTALAGLAQGLVEVGRKKEAFPVFEQIFARRPDDLSIRRSLASLAYELGKMETAGKLMVGLAAKKDADLDTLRMTARIFEELKDERTAATYWQLCLQHDSGDREAHGRLALYYEKLARLDKALPHLLALLEKDSDNASLLNRICRLYIQNGHFAKALPYFERYVALHPDNLDVLPVDNAGTADFVDIIYLYRQLLALTPADLELLDVLTKELSGGDPDSALFRWEHATRLHPDLIGVYQEIVDLIEGLARDDRLAEVLAIILRLAPDKIMVVRKLVNLKVARGELLSGLEYYNQLEKAGCESAELLAERGRLYEELGRLASALADYKRLLALQPNRSDIRRRCIALAGKLGENLFLKEQVALLEVAEEPANRDEDLLLAARAFAAAHDFDEALARYQLLTPSRVGSEPGGQEAADSGPLAAAADLGLADLYLEEGLVFKAEQLLRQMFLSGEKQGEVLARLFDISLSHDNQRLSEAEVWLEQYAALEIDPGGAELLEARLLAAAQDYDRAGSFLEELLDDNATGGKPLPAAVGRENGITRRAGLLLAEICIKTGDPDKAERLALAMLGEGRDREVLVVLEKIYKALGKEKAANAIRDRLFDEAGDSHDLLILAELYRDQGLLSGQIAAAEKAAELAPGSLTAAFLLAAGLAAEERYAEAVKLLEGMARTYPDNSSIILKMAHYYYLNGQYDSALHYCDRFLQKKPDRLDAHFLKMQAITLLGDQQYAAGAIKRLFPVKTAEILDNNVAAAGIERIRPPGEKTILQRLIFFQSSRASVAKMLMSARHLADNSSKEKKTLNYIAAQLYDRYCWEREFHRAAAGE
jgi:tetratricopeptide (TPR) repeat protein